MGKVKSAFLLTSTPLHPDKTFVVFHGVPGDGGIQEKGRVDKRTGHSRAWLFGPRWFACWLVGQFIGWWCSVEETKGGPGQSRKESQGKAR